MSIPKAAILTVGDELLDGRVVNSNAAYLAYRLTDIGFLVAATETVGDDEFAIADAIKGLTGRADTVIVVGGLGPTQDDVTREALAGAAGKLLKTDRALKKRIAEHTKGRAVKRNARMALLPDGATIFDNPIGTAPGLCVDTGGTPVYALPGVPMEMEALFEESIRDHIAQYFGASPLPVRILRTFGLKEAEIAEKLDDLVERGTGITARHGVITVVVSGDDADERADAMRERLGDHVFGEGDTTLAEVVLQGLKEKNLTVAMAESITGGLVASLLVDRPGASAVLMGGIVAYATPMKEKLLGVPGDLLERDGAVSSEVALEMARGARRQLGADVGIATTGVAGPDRDARGEPVGRGFIAVVTPDASKVVEMQTRGDREAIRMRFAWTAFDMVRRLL